MTWSQDAPPYLTTIVIQPIRRKSITCRVQMQELLHLQDAAMGHQQAKARCLWHQVAQCRLAVMVTATGGQFSGPATSCRESVARGTVTISLRQPWSATQTEWLVSIEWQPWCHWSRSTAWKPAPPPKLSVSTGWINGSHRATGPAWTSARPLAPLSYGGRWDRWKDTGQMKVSELGMAFNVDGRECSNTFKVCC